MPSESADPTKANDVLRVTDETTPLLTAPEVLPTGSTDDQPKPTPTTTTEEDDSKKPFPYLQIILLCYTALAEPVAYFAIFPFINEMIHRFGGIEKSSVGFYAGLIESLFSIVQMTLMIFYGRLADRIGRKPVLVFSLTGIGLANAAFGMSRSLWQMILMRCLAGTFAGSVVTVRTMIGENCTKQTQGKAFSWYMFTRNMGILIGPLIGGALANPSEQFPSVFGGVSFFEEYPYALASFTVGTMVLSSALLAFIFLDETLKRRDQNSAFSSPPMSTWEILQSPGVPVVLYIYSHINILATIYTAVQVVFMYEPIALGGLAFSDQEIAGMMAIAGASQAFWTLLVFPPLQKKFGTGSVMRWCVAYWPFYMASWPLLNEVLRQGWSTAFWIAAPISTAVGSGVAMGFACSQLFLNDISPSPAILGTVNALALTLTSGQRAFAPILGNSLFTAGIKSGFADGHAVWFLIVGLAATLNIPLYFLPEAAEGRPIKPVTDANEDE